MLKLIVFQAMLAVPAAFNIYTDTKPKLYAA
ncbi:protein of unknown function [Xenorhabdus doucetiae]|uniref:Uncharacterized protein n=2 Tax=Xenorhabdus doucetiae TaxID=351671 RepID=A0A068QQ93_9GAMM|nr:protein of unknown function [Xenorhabdus doucetiae]